MSNWALELQGFNLVRVWIRGEANILGDAPSRAPWENALADQLPIPDAPLREIIAKIYKQPPDFEKEIKLIAMKRKLPQEWKPLREEGSDDTDAFNDQQADAPTPQFGNTPRFGSPRDDAVVRAREIDLMLVGTEVCDRTCRRVWAGELFS